mgnify:FL=1
MGTLSHHIGQAVAPRAGAWIETTRKSEGQHMEMESRPARARGLKRLREEVEGLVLCRAPRGRVD